MSLRLKIPKLAGGLVPLTIPPRFRSELLHSGITWPQDVNYLRDTYNEIYELWSIPGTEGPENDQTLFQEARPKLRELLLGLDGVLQQVTNRPDEFRLVQNARHDFDISESYARSGDYAMATIYMSYSLYKLSRVLDGLMAMANRKLGKQVTAYGYDISGEVLEPGEQESRSPNLWDQGDQPKMDHTPMSPANGGIDAEAENEFPEELEHKHNRVNWPARTR